MQNDAAELKLLAERKAGALLAEMEKHPAGRPSNNRSQAATDFPPTLAELGIGRDQSSRWQIEASVSDERSSLASYIDSFEGDSTEFEKALRLLECRRGALLGVDVNPVGGRPPDNSPRVGSYDCASQTAVRYRLIARHEPEIVLPHLLAATERYEVTQDSAWTWAGKQKGRHRWRSFISLWCDPCLRCHH